MIRVFITSSYKTRYCLNPRAAVTRIALYSRAKNTQVSEKAQLSLSLFKISVFGMCSQWVHDLRALGVKSSNLTTTSCFVSPNKTVRIWSKAYPRFIPSVFLPLGCIALFVVILFIVFRDACFLVLDIESSRKCLRNTSLDSVPSFLQ